MDTVTHIALGACIGEVMLGKRLGRRASLIGALANSLPDIDIVATFWTSTDRDLLAHRGFTHSIAFALLATLLLAKIFERWFHRRTIHLWNWVLFFSIEILLHIFVDAFNNYGTGWFEPFSHQRISFNTLYVADPFFSIWIGVGLLGIVLCRTAQRRKAWSIFGLVLGSVYLLYAVSNKYTVERSVKSALRAQQVRYNSHLTTPAPLNNWLWFTVVGNDSGFYVGYRSVFDSKNKMNLKFFPKNEHLIDSIRGRSDVKNLIRFSQGFYTIEQWHDTLVFNDLRFGQTSGWEDAGGRFAFHYFLNLPDQNKLVVQRGRFAKWDSRSVGVLWRRIQGD